MGGDPGGTGGHLPSIFDKSPIDFGFSHSKLFESGSPPNSENKSLPLPTPICSVVLMANARFLAIENTAHFVFSPLGKEFRGNNMKILNRPRNVPKNFVQIC